jgi:mRNA interferase HigB
MHPPERTHQYPRRSGMADERICSRTGSEVPIDFLWNRIRSQAMRIIARPQLRDFGVRFPDAKGQLDAWWAEASAARWTTPAEIKEKYRSASILKGGRVVFNICGNKYRLIVKFEYERGLGFIRFIGTHKEYDQINAEVV